MQFLKDYLSCFLEVIKIFFTVFIIIGIGLLPMWIGMIVHPVSIDWFYVWLEIPWFTICLTTFIYFDRTPN